MGPRNRHAGTPSSHPQDFANSRVWQPYTTLDIGLSTDGSTATASRHALLLTTRICSDAPSNCLIVLRKLRRNNPISLPTAEAVGFLISSRKAGLFPRASH